MDTKALIYELVEWIDERLEMKLSVEIVTRKSGYSKWYLQRLFKIVTGVSLGRFIREQKLNKAAEELCVTNETVLYIALKYGFDSQQTFTRAFTRHFGVSPGVYRNSNKLKNENSYL